MREMAKEIKDDDRIWENQEQQCTQWLSGSMKERQEKGASCVCMTKGGRGQEG